jgi:membrane protein
MTIGDWKEDRASQLAAALSYYTLFSIAPLLLAVIAVSGMAFGDKAATGQLYGELRGWLGPDAASLVEEMVVRSRNKQAGLVASLVAAITMLVGASAVFNQLRDSLNTIWGVDPIRSATWGAAIRGRAFSFAMVIVMGLVLLGLLVINTVLSSVEAWMGDLVSGQEIVWEYTNMIASPIATAVIFAVMFRFLPDARIGWWHIFVGAIATSLLFTFGKYLFGLYLAYGFAASSYGAAASVIVLLLWAYYSALVLLLGAEFTQAHSRVFGKNAPTTRQDAVPGPAAQPHSS